MAATAEVGASFPSRSPEESFRLPWIRVSHDEVIVGTKRISRDQYLAGMYEFICGGKGFGMGGVGVRIPENVGGEVWVDGARVPYQDFVEEGMKVVFDSARYVDGVQLARDQIARVGLELLTEQLLKNVPQRDGASLRRARVLLGEANNGGISL